MEYIFSNVINFDYQGDYEMSLISLGRCIPPKEYIKFSEILWLKEIRKLQVNKICREQALVQKP